MSVAKDSVCVKTKGEHQWKFNGGNPMCARCGEHRDGPGRLTLPAHRDENGVIHVHWPSDGEADK